MVFLSALGKDRIQARSTISEEESNYHVVEKSNENGFCRAKEDNGRDGSTCDIGLNLINRGEVKIYEEILFIQAYLKNVIDSN